MNSKLNIKQKPYDAVKFEALPAIHYTADQLIINNFLHLPLPKEVNG